MLEDGEFQSFEFRGEIEGEGVRESVSNYMELEKRGVQQLKSLRISGEIVYSRAKLWWSSVTEKYDPRIRIPLLVLGDVIGWALLLILGFCVAVLGLLVLVLVLGVVFFPFYYFTLYLGWNNLTNRFYQIRALGVLAVSNFVLLYALWWLQIPETEDLRRRHGIDTELTPEKLFERFPISSLLVFWLGGSVYAAVFCLDVVVAAAVFIYTVYFSLSNCYLFLWFLVSTVPLYVILPTVLFTPLVFISLYQRMSQRDLWVQKPKPSFDYPFVAYAPVAPSPCRLPV